MDHISDAWIVLFAIIINIDHACFPVTLTKVPRYSCPNSANLRTNGPDPCPRVTHVGYIMVQQTRVAASPRYDCKPKRYC